MFNKLVTSTMEKASYTLEKISYVLAIAEEVKKGYDIVMSGKLYTLLEDYERDYVYELEGKKVDVVSDDMLLFSMNMLGGAALNIGNGYMILLQEDLDEAPSYVRDFILRHEEAHILNGDLEKAGIRNVIRNLKRTLINTPLGIVSKEERLADYHAYQINGKAQTISALEYIKAELELYGEDNKEVDVRIKLVKSYK